MYTRGEAPETKRRTRKWSVLIGVAVTMIFFKNFEKCKEGFEFEDQTSFRISIVFLIKISKILFVTGYIF